MSKHTPIPIHELLYPIFGKQVKCNNNCATITAPITCLDRNCYAQGGTSISSVPVLFGFSYKSGKSASNLYAISHYDIDLSFYVSLISLPTLVEDGINNKIHKSNITRKI
jgi:hypothetical protein